MELIKKVQKGRLGVPRLRVGTKKKGAGENVRSCLGGEDQGGEGGGQAVLGGVSKRSGAKLKEHRSGSKKGKKDYYSRRHWDYRKEGKGGFNGGNVVNGNSTRETGYANSP